MVYDFIVLSQKINKLETLGIFPGEKVKEILTFEHEFYLVYGEFSFPNLEVTVVIGLRLIVDVVFSEEFLTELNYR